MKGPFVEVGCVIPTLVLPAQAHVGDSRILSFALKVELRHSFFGACNSDVDASDLVGPTSPTNLHGSFVTHNVSCCWPWTTVGNRAA